MSTKRTRRLLLVAFVLSLLIHTLFAANVRWHLGSLEQTVERVSIVHRMRITKATPPPSTPPPFRPKVAVAAPNVLARPSAKGTEVVAAARATAPPTPAPTPVPSATANCLAVDTSPAVVASPPPPDIPPDARGDGVSGTTHVRVDIDARGVVTAAVVTASSGNAALDLIAQASARAAQYSPATHACKAIAASYDFAMKWIAW